MKYSQNINNKRDNSLDNENTKKNLSKIANYSSRNTIKRLIFTNSKPNMDFNENIINRINHTNLKKKTSNKIFSIIKIINNSNNFQTVSADFKLKSFIHNSSQNYQVPKINKTNLQTRFDDDVDKNKEKREETIYYGINKNNSIYFKMNNNLFLNNKDFIHKYIYKRNKSITNKNNITTKYNNYKNNEKTFNNYTSLLPKHKKGYSNMNNNILKSIIRLDYEDKKEKKMFNNFKGKQHSLSGKKNYNKSISYNFIKNNNCKIKDPIITIIEKKKKMNKNNTRHMESSVIVNRYKSPIAIRDLSESPKQRYLNNKTRYARIPWKIKKKGIDENKESNIVYNQYLNRLANPFNQNNSKIVNYGKFNKNNNLAKNTNNYNSKQKLNKTLWTTNIKQINLGKYNDCKNNKKKKSKNIFNYNEHTSRNKKKLFKEKLSSNYIQKNIEMENKNININTRDVNKDDNNKETTLNKNYFNSMSNSNLKISNFNSLSSMNTNLSNYNKNDYKTKNNFNNKKDSKNQNMNDNINVDNAKIHHKHNNSESISLAINLKNKFIINENNNEIYNPIDLSCLFINYKNKNEYINYIKNKLKKNCIHYIQKKSNVFICNKNGYNCKIELIKMNDDIKYNKTKNINNSDDNNGNIFYLKIYGKKEGYGINDIFKKFILNFG